MTPRNAVSTHLDTKELSRSTQAYHRAACATVCVLALSPQCPLLSLVPEALLPASGRRLRLRPARPVRRNGIRGCASSLRRLPSLADTYVRNKGVSISHV